ncbi:MAG: hypothetical protein P8100_01500 [bacterium]|jgi:hypothetical protein
MKKSFYIGVGLGFVATFWFFKLPFSYGRKLSGYIIAIFLRDNGDVIVKMNNDKHDFVISRGIDLELDLKKFQSKLIGKYADIWFTHPRWPFDMTPYITRLAVEGKNVYLKW